MVYACAVVPFLHGFYSIRSVSFEVYFCLCRFWLAAGNIPNYLPETVPLEGMTAWSRDLISIKDILMNHISVVSHHVATGQNCQLPKPVQWKKSAKEGRKEKEGSLFIDETDNIAHERKCDVMKELWILNITLDVSLFCSVWLPYI